ncbi:MAG: hypothetical protein Kow0077_17110 [Anaerolineae bacterium]
MRVKVIGLGNPILTDDGVGIYAVRLVRRWLPPDADVAIVELAVGGLELMEAMIGFDRVILVDAIWSPDQPPGTVFQFTAEALPDTMNSASAHDIDLPGALAAGRRMGIPLPEDAAIEIVAVSAREVLTFGELPTPPVLAAVPQAAARVMALLGFSAPDPLPERVEVAVAGGYDGIS